MDKKSLSYLKIRKARSKFSHKNKNTENSFFIFAMFITSKKYKESTQNFMRKKIIGGHLDYL